MQYISTRGNISPLDFQDAVLTGQAADGGLVLPERIPSVGDKLDSWKHLSFVELAVEIVRLFATDIVDEDLESIISGAFASFDHPDTVPMVEQGSLRIMELFHGPTLAFKDVALQVLGGLFKHVLGKRNAKLNILGATSGDTGSAAIASVRGRENINIFIMFPDGKTSRLQELQMTTVLDSNVHCLAIEGDFDDCQRIMKSIFNDLDFKNQYALGAVNSVNWARVMVQVVYYAYAALQTNEPVSISVPTGNFGNICAGYIARRMGFPIHRLILATNENDILARFFSTGVYRRGSVHQTLSPSMDIQVASNFERYVYYLFEEDSQKLKIFMKTFADNESVEIKDYGKLNDCFVATRVDTSETLSTISNIHSKYGYVIDPHTAVGVAAALRVNIDTPIVSLATAHPSKFPESVKRAIGQLPINHPRLEQLNDLEERKVTLPADEMTIRRYLESNSI
jgi:threonine synthase|tara:strand:+ start:2357 stop:3718 length:1362 start_codon:yes stop_codon:yes gene_type:complete